MRILMMSRTFQKTFAFAVVICGLSLFPSCRDSIQRVCSEDLAKLDVHVDDAMVALVPWLPIDKKRALASVPSEAIAEAEALPQDPVLLIPQADRLAWENWAGERLKQVQRYLELLETDSTLSPNWLKISHLADQFVRFHGYSSQGDASKMLTSLRLIRESNQSLRESFCAPKNAP